ncbi:hypothetical protein [Nocardiopsis sp. LOL_012]|uniref:hypothetical protein n=1 Tax=Nocardiopsis sp. LOL_012 TaxID=3345409 RepID=UPI003A879ECD
MASHSLKTSTALDQGTRQMPHTIATRRLAQSMPLDVPAALTHTTPRHTWYTRLHESPSRFTLYTGELLHLTEPVRTVLTRELPRAHLVSAPTTTAFPWPEAPRALAALISSHLRPCTRPAR